jgi:hypothetical protein
MRIDSLDFFRHSLSLESALFTLSIMDSLHALAANAAERPTILVALVLVFLVSGLLKLSPREKQPPYLKERIPYVTNTIQYLTDVGTFLNRVT